MDQLIFKRLLEDSSLFSPTGDHRAIEVSTFASAGPQTKETILDERQLIPWCLGNSKDNETVSVFRLLICSPRMTERDISPLPLSSNSLGSILDILQISPLFLRAVCRHNPIASLYECFDEPERYGILLRTNLSHAWQYALALVYDAKNNITTGLLLGLRGNEIDEVVFSIRQASQHIACPSVLPCILVDKALDALVKDAEDRRIGLMKVLRETHSHGFSRQVTLNDSWDIHEDLDLDRLMQRLTSLSDACAGIAAVCKMQHNFVNAISDLQHRFNPTGDKSVSHCARQQLRFFAQMLCGVESKVNYTKSSVQDQVQTIYTLINQRESRSQMIIAKTSRRLAELTRQDSTDMRVISAVTLVFLPATFTASLFSASFFKFEPEGPGHVSSWIWLYWVITTVLTGIALASWWFFSRRQHAKAMAATQKESLMDHRAFEETEPSKTAAFKSMAGLGIPRQYLGGSSIEDIFAREVPIPSTPCNSKAETQNILPTAT